MNSKEFKNVFDEVAKRNGFKKAFGGWFRESPECIIVLALQKSNYGDYYELLIKIYIQGLFEKIYFINKDLVNKEVGHIRSGASKEKREIFDFDNPMDEVLRKERLEKLFSEFIVPFTERALSKSGIRNLAERGEIFLLPAVKEELA